MNRQRKVIITITYNDLGIIVDTKAEELDLSAQPDLQPTCNNLATDTISRQATIYAMECVDWYHINKNGQLTHGANSEEDEPLYKAKDVYKVLNDMPSAQPEQKTGTFIGTEYDGFADGNPVYYEWECSECGCVFEGEEPTYNYCPSCGAKLEVSNGPETTQKT